MGEDWWRDLLHLTQRHDPQIAAFLGRMVAQYQAGQLGQSALRGLEPDIVLFDRIFRPLITRK